MNVLSESGMIDANGRLRLPMERVTAFTAANKGKRIIARFEVVESGTSMALMAYYYNYIVPTVCAALRETGERLNEESTDKFLINNYPGDTMRDGNGAAAFYARQLNQHQMLDFLEWIKQFASENLYVYIEDPRTI